MEQFCAVKRQDERDDRVKQLMEAKIIAIQQEISYVQGFAAQQRKR